MKRACAVLALVGLGSAAFAKPDPRKHPAVMDYLRARCPGGKVKATAKGCVCARAPTADCGVNSPNKYVNDVSVIATGSFAEAGGDEALLRAAGGCGNDGAIGVIVKRQGNRQGDRF